MGKIVLLPPASAFFIALMWAGPGSAAPEKIAGAPSEKTLMSPPLAPEWLLTGKTEPAGWGSSKPSPLYYNGLVIHQARKITLWWPRIPGATSYRIYRGAQTGQESASAVVHGLTATTYTDTGLKDATQYFYQVTACSAGRESAKSPEASAATKAPPKLTMQTPEPSQWTGIPTITTNALLRVDTMSEDSHLTYRWASVGVPPAKVTIGEPPNRNLSGWFNFAEVKFAKSGAYKFTVTVTDSDGLSAIASVAVTVNPIPTTITVTPNAITLHCGASQRFTAATRDQFGHPISPTPKFVWSAPLGDAVIDPATGVFTTPKFRPGPPLYSTIATAEDPATRIKGTASVVIRDRGPILRASGENHPR